MTSLSLWLPVSKMGVLLLFSTGTGRRKKGKLLKDRAWHAMKSPKAWSESSCPFCVGCAPGKEKPKSPNKPKDYNAFVFLLSMDWIFLFFFLCLCVCVPKFMSKFHLQELRMWPCLESGSFRKSQAKMRPSDWPHSNILNHFLSAV